MRAVFERRCARPGFQDVTSDLQLKNPQVEVEIEPRPGRHARHLGRADRAPLTTAYGSRRSPQIYARTTSTTSSWSWCPSTSWTRRPCRCSTCARTPGKLVPLSAVVSDPADASGPLSVNHTGQLPSVTLSFNLKPGVALGDAVDARAAGWRARCCRRRSRTSFQGTAQAFQDSMKGLGWAAGAGDPRHLHRARDSLRELHPPDHDSLGACRRPASARCSRCCCSTTT